MTQYADLNQTFSHHTTIANGVTLHYMIGGDGALLLLWHGFLETWYCWRKVMPALAEKYTVIAPDMRGYGDSEKPKDGYDARTLAILIKLEQYKRNPDNVVFTANSRHGDS